MDAAIIAKKGKIIKMYDHFLVSQRAAELLGVPCRIDAYSDERGFHIVIEGSENGRSFFISLDRQEKIKEETNEQITVCNNR